MGDKNTKKEQGGQYDTAMVASFLILFNAAVLLLLLFAATIYKFLLLMQGLAKLFLKVTLLLGYNNIKKERGDKDNMVMVLFLLLLVRSEY